MTPLLTEPPVEQETTLSADELREAFRLFTEASDGFSARYEAMKDRVQELDLQLAEANAELQRQLTENARVKDYLAAILAALPVGVVVVDGKRKVKTLNPAARAILGIGESEAIGRPLEEVLGWRADASSAGALPVEIRCEARVEIAVPDEDGELREVEVIVLPASAEQRSAFGGVVALHDVTRIKRLEQRAATVSRLTAMGEMAMNVAHEIRNPLGSIELFASALARDLDDCPHQQQLAEHISAGVRSIESIVENILQFNRPRRLAKREVDLEQTVRDSLCFASHLLQQRSIEVDVHADADAPRVVVDSELLKQVFLNLALNAAQAMERGGRLEIRLSRRGAMARVEMLDEGPGIDPDLLPRIFDPFVTTKPKGTGLGLTIVHNLVTAHGGTIDMANRPGGGARATVELPLSGAGCQPARW
ncbi:MAG: ATP-binding protein [Candidatus Sumerlaeota bacterium]|nr:ATP-binding protein [Candidatus Sumerlaeota bacterium]